MTASKSVLTIGSLATAMLFGGGLYLYMNFNSLAKNLAEKYASRTLGVAVSIGDLAVSVQDRRIDVTNLRIANPAGYQKPHAATVQNITIQAGVLTAELLEFKDVSVNGADIFLEVKPSATNLTDIRENVNANTGENARAGEQAIKVILEKMVMTGTIHPSVTLLQNEISPIKLPPITLEGIGTKSNGVLVNEAIGQIWREISSESIAAANRNGFLEGLDRDALEKAGMDEVQILKDQITQEVDKVTDGLKKIFD